jgi:plastocyanin
MRLGFGEILAVLVLAGCGASSMAPASGTVNGCAAGDFVPAAADGGVAQVQYGDPIGLAYSPKCLSIAAGQSVTFVGDTTRASNFSVHPLRPGGASGTDPGSSGNPIAAQNGGPTYTVAFATAGTYGYFCQAHQGMGMYGAVQVK